MSMNEDFLDLLSALNAADVRFLVVGAYAVGVHGRPRATKDLDVWIEASKENGAKVMAALRDFGAPIAGITADDFAMVGTGFKMGQPPRRIDILTQIEGVTFDDAWPRRIETMFGSVRCGVIGFEDLLRNKRAAARLQDLADVAALERLAKKKREPPR
jgi:hypothetical protein